MRFLVVEDMVVMRRLIINTLNGLGYYEVDGADNGEEAWEMLAQNDYDCIITDWLMPGMDGVELTKLVRQTPATRHIPILMITVQAERNNVRTALKAGISDFIVKPFNSEILINKLDKMLSNREDFAIK